MSAKNVVMGKLATVALILMGSVETEDAQDCGVAAAITAGIIATATGAAGLSQRSHP